MLKEIVYPEHILRGILANHRAYPIDSNLRLFGADTETETGEPMTVGAYDGSDMLFEYVDSKTIFKTFVNWIFPRCRAKGVNICYFHYLKFDMPIIFYEKRLEMYEQVSEIKFTHHGYECDLLFGKVNKFEISKDDIKLTVLDSFAFTTNSLEKSVKQFQIPYEKHERPPRIGRVRYDTLPVDDPERIYFEKYGRQDLISEYHLGKKIMGYHREYAIRPSISLPQFSTRVLRHHFMKPSEVIQFPPRSMLKGCEMAYHGGKNGKYPPDSGPVVVEDCWEADISSAYPHAMTVIPQMVQGTYAMVSEYDPETVGIYKISGEDKGMYPIVFGADFKRTVGPFKDVWISSYELEAALESPDVRIDRCEGFVWVPDDGYDHSPLRHYVEHFYKLKSDTPKKDPNYYFYKIILNAPSGKFVQATEIRKFVKAEKVDGDLERKATRAGVDFVWDEVLQDFVQATVEYRAGGLYNPFIAALITGHTRAKIYRLERKYHALHTATDSIKTTHKPKESSGLGGLKLETFGRCYLFRNKLYLHFCRDCSVCGHDPKDLPIRYPKDHPDRRKRGQPILDEDGQHLCKFALHGFKGQVWELFEARHQIMKEKKFTYTYGHMIGLREGLRQRRKVCSMWDDKPETLVLK